MSDLIEALKIFRRYGNPEWPTHCEHDVMMINIDYTIISDKDKEKLNHLGFIEDVENNKFKSYKFGSA